MKRIFTCNWSIREISFALKENNRFDLLEKLRPICQLDEIGIGASQLLFKSTVNRLTGNCLSEHHNFGKISNRRALLSQLFFEHRMRIDDSTSLESEFQARHQQGDKYLSLIDADALTRALKLSSHITNLRFELLLNNPSFEKINVANMKRRLDGDVALFRQLFHIEKNNWCPPVGTIQLTLWQVCHFSIKWALLTIWEEAANSKMIIVPLLQMLCQQFNLVFDINQNRSQSERKSDFESNLYYWGNCFFFFC